MKSIQFIAKINGVKDYLGEYIPKKYDIYDGNLEIRPRFYHLFTNRTLQRACILLSIQSIFECILFFGIPFFLPLISKNYILNLILLGLAGMLSDLAAGKINYKLGKKKSLLYLSFFVFLVFSVFWMYKGSGLGESSVIVGGLIFMGSFGIFTSGYTNYTLIGNCFPVSLRSFAYGFVGFPARILLFLFHRSHGIWIQYYSFLL